jgi:Protein of unknown function (DUF2628).
MADYIGKICPYCKTALTSFDDIVVCSVCEMPHHKDCWVENKGCTTFGCMGTIDSAGNHGDYDNTTQSYSNTDSQPGHTYASQQSSTYLFCTRCGAKNFTTSSFCRLCGNRLISNFSEQPIQNSSSDSQLEQTNSYAASNAQDNSTFNTTEIDEESLYIQTNLAYYRKKFNRMRSGGKASWNWCAFFVCPYWFIYRKMYGWGFGVFALGILLSATKLSFLSIVAFIIFGLFGNSIYMSAIDQYKEMGKYMSEQEKAAHIKKHGGTNSTAVFLTIVGYLIVIGIITSNSISTYS